MYIGSTKDIKKRLAEHNAGKNKSTKAYLPWSVIFYEAYVSEDDALRREKYFKTTSGKRTLRQMLKSYLSTDRFIFDN